MSNHSRNAQCGSRKLQKVSNNSNTSGRGTPRGRSGGQVGKLALLFGVPMDVFFEILSHLPPLDILRMARTSTAFRKLLMSRTSRHIWITSRRNVVPTLPECPGNISEPRYASVLFERTCQDCGAGRAMNVDYAVFVRLCDNCWKARVKKGGVLAYNSGLYYDPDFMNLVFSLLPRAPYEVYKPFSSYRTAGMAVNPPVEREHLFYHEPEFGNVADEYRKLCSGKLTGSMKQFLVQRCIDTRVRLAFAEKILDWELARTEASKQVKGARRIAIEGKLRELGFKPQDFPFRNKEFDKMLTQPRDLTPRIWNNIRPKLLELLQAEQRRRETVAFKNAWSVRRSGISQCYQRFLESRRDLDVWERMIFPGFEEAMKIPAMEGLLFSGQPDQPVSREQFAAIEPELIVDVADAMAKVRRKLAALLKGEAAEGKTSSGVVSKQKGSRLATTGDSRKGKGKARADTPGADGSLSGLEDAEADKALLEQLTSIFVCEHRACTHGAGVSRPALMSFLSVLEHQSLHSTTHGSWDDIAVAPADPTLHTCMPDLLDAISLPRDSKLSAVRERILSGVPRCDGCAAMPGPGAGAGAPEGALLSNMLRHVSGPTGVDMTTMQPVYGRHNITFHPSPWNSRHYGSMPSMVGMSPDGISGFMPGGTLPLVDAGYIAGLLPQHLVMPFPGFPGGIPPVMQPFVHVSAQAGPSASSLP